MADGPFIIGFTPSGEPVFSMDSPGVPKTIPSYLYTLYQDDDDLQAFVAEYNTLTQGYVDWFNQVDLPIYTGPLIVGYFLDWVSMGLYGYVRPAGTMDDVLKRSLTWHFYKGDGRYFDVRWLKRRVMRFLEGVDGTDQGTASTYDVSVVFAAGYSVTIDAQRVNITGAIYHGGERVRQTFPNGVTVTRDDYKAPFLYGNTCYNGNPPTIVQNPTTVPVNNQWNITLTASFTSGPDLKAGIDAKQLELPFQLLFTVTV